MTVFIMSQNNGNVKEGVVVGKAAKRYMIDDEQLRMICETAARAGVEAYKEEHTRAEIERSNRVLNNAKKLIVNYRRFKGMCENSVYDKNTSADTDLKEVLELMSGNFRDKDFTVLSIKEKVSRTKMMMEHVDAMIEVYRKHCEASPDPEELRRYEIIEQMYMSECPKKPSEIAEEENITVSTVYRDIDKACKKLAVLFFGIDGVRF